MCRIEHTIDSEITTRLVECIELLDCCPRMGFVWFRNTQYHCRNHNKRQCDQWMERAAEHISLPYYSQDLMAIHQDSMPLTDVLPGFSVLIISLGNNKSKVKEIHKREIVPNLHIVMIRKNDRDQSIELESKGEKWLLTQEEAAALEVLPCDPA